MSESISKTPRTSPAFQSVFGESLVVLWQLTQACAVMISAAAVRTTCLLSCISARENVALGLAIRNFSLVVETRQVVDRLGLEMDNYCTA